MNTQQIAERLVQLSRTGEYDAIYDELFAPDAIGVWPAGTPEESPTIGIDAMKQKGKEREAMFEKLLWIHIGEPIVANDHFAVVTWFEAIQKGQTEPSTHQEIIVYTVRDGKIVKEEYFY